MIGLFVKRKSKCTQTEIRMATGANYRDQKHLRNRTVSYDSAQRITQKNHVSTEKEIFYMESASRSS